MRGGIEGGECGGRKGEEGGRGEEGREGSELFSSRPALSEAVHLEKGREEGMCGGE